MLGLACGPPSRVYVKNRGPQNRDAHNRDGFKIPIIKIAIIPSRDRLYTWACAVFIGRPMYVVGLCSLCMYYMNIIIRFYVLLDSMIILIVNRRSNTALYGHI